MMRLKQANSFFSQSVQGKYRADIDGMRAVAVMAVVLFHAFPRWLPGGFVGVDVFFVISGYLISAILYREMETNTYSYAKFMARRARRILPALCFMVATVAMISWYVLNSNELLQLGKEIVSGFGFVSNFLFWLQSGYFDSSSESKPLLHLWSLAVEEQFYIVWPFVLAFAMKRRLNITKLSVLLIFISLGAELLVMKWDQDAAFYMLPFRFYELMVGALLASIGKNGSSDTFLGYRLRPRQRDIVSVVALASLLASFFMTDKQTFPGLWPLLPVFSTALLIGVGPFSVVNRFILSFRPMVFCGLISYPLYLWHWPLLSIPFIVEGGAPNWRLRASLVAAAVLMSILTFYFLEMPFQRLWRNLDQSDSIRKLLKISGMGIISFISVGSLIWIFNGFSYRDQAVQQTINNGDVGQQSFHKYMARYKACLPNEIFTRAPTWGGFVRCSQSLSGENHDIIIVGDSHSEQLFIGLVEALPGKNIVYYLMTDLPFDNGKRNQAIWRQIYKERNHVEAIFVASHWADKIAVISDEAFQEGMSSLISKLAPASVIFVKQTPVFDFDPSRCAIERRFRTSGTQCAIPLANHKAKVARFEALVRKVNIDERTKLIDMTDLFCKGDSCAMNRDGLLLYRDYRHLNIHGSMAAGRFIAIASSLRI